jgi:putative membrane protein
MERPILVLCIDRDNDLYEKAKVSGPLIGRKKNLDGALKLAIADPEDPDSNAIFYSIKVFEQMKKEGHTVEVVTLTGDKSMGYKADKEISNQLDKIVRELNPSSCVLISDGASDEEIIPIIKSRLKIDSTKIVFIKQAKELEKTYFVLIEKLKDPYYAKTLVGIPALLILLLSISSYYGLGWEPVGIIVGLYLIIRMLGIDEHFGNFVRDVRFSVEKTSWVSYIAGFTLFVIGALIASQSYNEALDLGLGGEKLIAYVIRSVVMILLIGVILLLSGKAMDALSEKKKYEITKYALYIVGFTLAMVVLKVGSDWVLNLFEPYVNFSDFLLTLVLSICLAYVSTKIINGIRMDMLIRMKLEGKEAISENGTYLGKIVGVDGRKGKLVIQTMFEKKYSLPASAVTSIEDNVILRTGD